MYPVKYIGFLKEETVHQFIDSAEKKEKEVNDRQRGDCTGTFLEPTGWYHSPSQGVWQTILMAFRSLAAVKCEFN